MLALIYSLSDDYLDRRPEFREEHLALAGDWHERGDLLLAGAFSDTFDKALFVWSTDDEAVVRGFVATDPYVANGLVIDHEIRVWNVVIGNSS